MADNGDGTYSFNYSVVLDGAVTVIIKLDNKGVINWRWYSNLYFAEPATVVGTTPQLYFSGDYGYTTFIPGQVDYFTGKLTGKIKPPTSETYTFTILQNDWSQMSFNGYMYVNNVMQTGMWTNSFSIFLDKNTYYDFIFYFYNGFGGYGLVTWWSTATISQQIVPANNFVIPYLVASSPYQITTSWPTGFYGTVVSSPTKWATIWGDGIKAGTEACDDGNNIDNDGWQADCTIITPGFAWSTGSILVAQTWVKCTTAFYPNSDKSACVPLWGDAMRAGFEIWDDGNTYSGDGWSNTWASIEDGFIWSGGSLTSKDIWIKWSSGYYQNNSKNQWVWKWGDGLRVSSEYWDDGTTINGDGWRSDCLLVETDYIWRGGSSTSKDIWTKWDKGYHQNSYPIPTEWVVVCGDGLRAGNEVCDDGNTVSGDGWAADCMKIEDGWAWVGGWFGVTDVCLKWDPGYGSNTDYTTCIGTEVPRDVKSIAVAFAITAAAGVSSTMLVTMFSSSTSSSSNSFGMINQIQLVILLPLIGAFLPQKIYDYLKSMNASLFNLSFLPSSNSESSINIKSWFNFKQPDSYLYLLQLSSGSALVNILSLTTVVGTVIWLHILILILYAILFKLNKLHFVKKLIVKILEMLTFGFYIGVWTEIYILFLIVDFSEIHYQNKYGIQNMNSWVASYIIMFCMLLFILLALWQWCKSKKPENFEKQKYFVAIVDGMKPKWIYRSYSFVFLVRRTLFCAVLFFFDFVEAFNRVIILTSLQFIYMLYIIILRPHDSIKENLIEVINEVLYLYYLGFMLHFNTENSWDDTTTEIYFWILMWNNFILIFITAGKY